MVNVIIQLWEQESTRLINLAQRPPVHLLRCLERKAEVL